MGILTGKKYRNCQPGEDGNVVECQAYRPSKDGNRQVVAVLRARKSPDCKAHIEYEDGDPEDIADLTEYLNKTMGVKCVPKNA